MVDVSSVYFQCEFGSFLHRIIFSDMYKEFLPLPIVHAIVRRDPDTKRPVTPLEYEYDELNDLAKDIVRHNTAIFDAYHDFVTNLISDMAPDVAALQARILSLSHLLELQKID